MCHQLQCHHKLGLTPLLPDLVAASPYQFHNQDACINNREWGSMISNHSEISTGNKRGLQTSNNLKSRGKLCWSEPCSVFQFHKPGKGVPFEMRRVFFVWGSRREGSGVWGLWKRYLQMRRWLDPYAAHQTALDGEYVSTDIPNPRYNPRIPSALRILRIASMLPSYLVAPGVPCTISLWLTCIEWSHTTMKIRRNYYYLCKWKAALNRNESQHMHWAVQQM